MNEEERQAALRRFAESIIAGEYSAVVISVMHEDKSVQSMYDGGRIVCLGLVTDLAEEIKLDGRRDSQGDNA